MREQGLDLFQFIRRIEEQMSTIKEYQFPNIFQNVIGDVVPLCALQQSRLFKGCHQRLGQKQMSQQLSIPSSMSDRISSNSNLFGPRGQQKKMVRRVDYSRTGFLLSSRNHADDAQASPVDSTEKPKFTHFLKKKAVATDSVVSRDDKKSHKSSRKDKQMSLSQLQKLEKQQLLKRGKHRMRTSADRAIRLDGIEEQSDEEKKIRLHKKSSTTSYVKDQEKRLNLNQDPMTQPQKPQKKNILKRSSHDKKQMSRSMKKAQTKKTVFFGQEESQSRIKRNKKRRQSKSNSILSKRSSVLSNEFNKQGKSKVSRFRSKQYTSEASSMNSVNFLSGKSVCSIKFNSSDEKSESKQKSLRSMESVLKSERNLAYRTKLNKTRSAKMILRQPKVVQRRRKSEQRTKVSEFSATKQEDQKIMIQDKYKRPLKTGKSFNHRKGFNLKRVNTQKSTVSIKNQSMAYCKTSQKQFSNNKKDKKFNESHAKIRNNRGLLKTQLSTHKATMDVYDELNQFLRFINQKQNIIDSEREIKQTFNKPLVIADQKIYRQVNQNRELFDRDNMCISMGLQMVRRINKLAQKKY